MAALVLLNLIMLPILVALTWDTTPSEGYWTAVLTILTAYPTLLIAGFALLYSTIPLRMQLALVIFRRGWRQPVFLLGLVMIALVILAGFRGLVAPNHTGTDGMSFQDLQFVDNLIAPLSIVLLFLGLEMTGLLAWDFLRLQRPQRLAQMTHKLVSQQPDLAAPLVSRLTDVVEHESGRDDNEFKCFVMALSEIAATLAAADARTLRQAEPEGIRSTRTAEILSGDGPGEQAQEMHKILKEIVHLYTLSSRNRDQGLACLEALETYLNSVNESEHVHALVAAISDDQLGAALLSNDHPSEKQVSKLLEISANIVRRRDPRDLKVVSTLHDQLIGYWVERSLPRDVHNALLQSLPWQLQDSQRQLDLILHKSVPEELRGREQEIFLKVLQRMRESPSPKPVQRSASRPIQSDPKGALFATLLVRVAMSTDRDNFRELLKEFATQLNTLDVDGQSSFHERVWQELDSLTLKPEDVQRFVQMLSYAAIRNQPQSLEEIRSEPFASLAPAIQRLIAADFTAFLRGMSAALLFDPLSYSRIRESCEGITSEVLRGDEWLQTSGVVAALTPATLQLRTWWNNRKSPQHGRAPDWSGLDEAFLVDLSGRDSWYFRAGLGADLGAERGRAYWRWAIEQLTACWALLRAIGNESLANGSDSRNTTRDGASQTNVRALPVLWYRLASVSLALAIDVHALSRDPEALALVASMSRMLTRHRDAVSAVSNDPVLTFARKSVREYLVERPPAQQGDSPPQAVWSILEIRNLLHTVFDEEDEIHDDWLNLALESLERTPPRNLGERSRLLAESLLPGEWSVKFGLAYGEKPGPYEENCEALIDMVVEGNASMAQGLLRGVIKRGGGSNWRIAFIDTLMKRVWERDGELSVMDVLNCYPESEQRWVPHSLFHIASDWLVQAVGAGDLAFARNISGQVREHCEVQASQSTPRRRAAQDAFMWRVVKAAEKHQVNCVEVLNCDEWLTDALNRMSYS